MRIVAVEWGQVGTGIGLFAWCIGCALYYRWGARSDEVLRRAAERRAGPDIVSGGRSLLPNRERWIERNMKRERFFGRWAGPTFMAVCALMSLTLVVRGLTH